ncbi:hypothetical protein BU23DRAFT_575358 [Bimuria novae-zelandiae CBS 107.79]|uniref:Uncharacterized protein n=1 Tax=Bimuria novae-zelandiae CBS 107.79 TaxID=1447943 RepID=A0A6A5UM35_9PLEO|nr:hypothetical protein BU23DRAFT_575358 [Bimuria novae-zelandiae CBS 107.79]
MVFFSALKTNKDKGDVEDPFRANQVPLYPASVKDRAACRTSSTTRPLQQHSRIPETNLFDPAVLASRKEKEEEKRKQNRKRKEREEIAAKNKAIREAKSRETADKKRWKREWDDYVKENDVHGATLDEEPVPKITQTDAGQLYTLKPNELACLPHFPKPNYYDATNITKVFDESDVEKLAFRKYAMLSGMAREPEKVMLARGKDLWEEEGRRGPGESIWRPSGEFDIPLEDGSHANWWRDPRELRSMGYENGRIRTKRSNAMSDSFDD